jgi:methyl-accepting chemotaxis protein
MDTSNMKIGTRLGIGFSFILLLVVGLIVLSLSNMSSINASLLDVVNFNNVKLAAATDMRDAQRRIAIITRNISMPTELEEKQAQASAGQKARADYATAATRLHGMLTLPASKATLAKIEQDRALAMPLMDKAAKFGMDNQAELAAATLLKEVAPLASKWQDALGEMIEFQTELNKSDAADAQARFEATRLWLIGLGALAVLLVAVIAVLSTRAITLPLARAVRIARAVAAGDLTHEIEVRSNNETGQLLQALKEMNASLLGIVTDVRIGTDVIATASSQIASGNLDLSSRTEQQASSLEETASSMEELTKTVKQNAQHAMQANELAVSASDIALQGGSVVSQVVETMSSINASSKKIVDIISVIDGIAFQTNILALNAAVEAARAGEQGRGFAVVASEVRNLAQRSASAAKEIKTLINDSVEKVDFGSKLVDQAGATMGEVVSSVQRVSDIVREITAASQDQSIGIDQINQAIAQMDQVVQQNAALVEEAAAAAGSLEDQAATLLHAVSVFTIEAAQSGRAPRAHAATVTSISHRHAAAPARLGKPAALARAASSPQRLGKAPAVTSADREWVEF